MANKIYNVSIKLWIIILMFSVISCEGQKKASPKGYDLNAPVKYSMPQNLFEISGIAFNKGNAKQVYAIQDENGDLFHFALGDKNIKFTKFAGKGDYEDVSICRNQVIVLRSDGALYTFPLAEANKEEVQNPHKLTDLLPKGEYEGLYADEKTAQIYIMTKQSKLDVKQKQTGIFIFKLTSAGNLELTGAVNVAYNEVSQFVNDKKINFHPSALAKNNATNEWYMLSSVNKLLVVADDQFKVKAAYPLSSNTFNQPEGIAFDQQQNLYISNEGGDFGSGNILLFKYKK